MSLYKQLTRKERYQIYTLLQPGYGKEEIRKHLSRDKLTIYREVKRNSGKRGYRPEKVHKKPIERRVRIQQRFPVLSAPSWST